MRRDYSVAQLIVFKVLFILTLCLILSLKTFSQTVEAQSDSVAKDSVIQNASSGSTTPTLVDTVIIIPRLDFKETALSDLFTALARAYNLSLFVDSSVTDRVNIRLDNVTLNDALLFILNEYNLSWKRTGDILKIYKEKQPIPVPPPLDVTISNNLLTVNLDNADLSRFIDTLIDMTGANIILESNAQGRISGRLSSMELNKALQVILSTNGYTYKKIDNIIYVGVVADSKTASGRSRNLLVRCDNGSSTLDVSNSPLSDVITRLATECGKSVLLQTTLEGTITASFSERTFADALTYLLLNSAYTFKESHGVYFIGNRESQDLYVSKLITLDHLIASNLQELIPTAIADKISIKVVAEHNGLMLTGPLTTIARVEDFIKEVDIPIAQVLFDVIVVDYLTNENFKFSLTANNSGQDSTLPGEIYYPGLDVSGTGSEVNRTLNSLERRLSISNLGTVGSDFFLRLQLLQSEGKANVRSRPQIAALNGHAATIRIGQTQYFLLEDNTTFPAQGQATTRSSQHFETIEADMKLEVTPYVNQNDELTVILKQEFNTPAGRLDPKIPPTINRRELSSTVRLRDGDTIVLGGLIQSTDSETIDKVPLLGSIPLIGKLFQNRSTEKTESELMIYITPHIYYGADGAVSLEEILKER